MSFRLITTSTLLAMSGALLLTSAGCGLPAPASDGADRIEMSVPQGHVAPVEDVPLAHTPPPMQNLSMTEGPSSPDGAGTGVSTAPADLLRAAVKLYADGMYREAGEAALRVTVAYRDTAWEGRAAFLAARAYAAQDDASAASVLFEAARQKLAVLADHALYLEANAYAKAGRIEEASARYDELVSAYPDSPLVPAATLEAARHLIGLGRCQDALDRLHGFLKEKQSPSRTAEALYLLMKGFAGLGDHDNALGQYGILWREYPGDPATVKAEKVAAELAGAGHTQAEPSLDDRIRRADRLFAKGQYRRAAGEYALSLERLGNKSALRGEALLRLGRSYYSLRENDKAVRAFREVIEGGYDAQAPESYYWLSKTHLRTGGEGLKDTVMSCLARYPGDPKTADCMYLLGVTALSDGDYGLAMQTLKKLLADFPKTDRRDEALWWLGLADYRLGDYRAAGTTFGSIADGYPGSTLAPQALYWKAKSAGMLGRAEDAAAIYAAAASEYGNSFYGLLAEHGGALSVEEAYADGYHLRLPRRASQVPEYAEGASVPLDRAVELGLLGMKAEAKRELRLAEDRHGRGLDGLLLIAAVYNSMGEYQRPLELAGGLYGGRINTGRGGVPGEALEMLFPLAYPDIVLKESDAFGIDPALVYAVMREESRFNPEAVSPAGAVGLMQLMPGTAKAVCLKLNVGFDSSEQLKDEVFNVPLGTCYLASLVDRHGGRLAYALAEYNAGPGPLKRWIDRDPSAPDEEFVEGITYYETRSYVRRVLRNYMMYKRLYGVRPAGEAVGGGPSPPAPLP